MLSHNIETEAKFIIPDQTTFSALQQLTRLHQFEITPIGAQEIVDQYLDTPDKILYKAGIVCRIREVKGRRILTLKSLTPATGLIHRRQEFELEVTSNQPQEWPGGEASEMVLNLIGETPLQTLFTLFQTRYKFHVYYRQQCVIELSLDRVSLPQQDAIDYLGLEAELMTDGTETDLTLFTQTLQQHWPLDVDPFSKFERALAALGIE
ncbi:MAG: CYTH domain-containing protein [Anaerolineae bacterium]|nr:CYTH domain-containing protein [Anaerolineae bacterium]